MPRDIPIGNGKLLVNFDQDYCVRDIYYPCVGKENHTDGHKFRFGILVEKRFSWVNRDWALKLGYADETLLTHVVALNESLGARLHCNDLVDYRKNIYIKKVIIKNLAAMDREFRLFFHHDFHILASATGDTAYYDWFICTLWFAQWYIAKAKSPEELKEAIPILEWVTSRALPSGILAEQVHPFTNQPLSISLLSWSHATFVAAVLEYLYKMEGVYVCPSCGMPMDRYERKG